MISNLNAAIEYAKKGWRILPIHSILPNGICSCGRADCQSPGKHPRVSGGLKSASCDPARIKAWWTSWPSANIGCVCGKESFTVIDVDARSGGMDALSSLTKEYGPIPNTMCQKTGGGGMHYFFKHSDDIPCSAGVLAPGIDIRSQGKGYVLLPPSRHKSGCLYEWINFDTPLAEIPEWLYPHKRSHSAVVTRHEKQSVPPSDVEARAIAYLATVPPAVQGRNGHSALLWAARCLVVGFELAPAVAERILWDSYNPRCVPPWDPAVPAQAKDFSRKISEALSTPSELPKGWLLDNMVSADDDISLGISVANNLLNISDEVPQEDALPSDAAGLKNPVLPPEILTPPGLVGDIVSWINSSAGCPQPLLSLGAAITMCGALFGRKVRDHSDGRTNVYALGIAHSSAGKDHPSDCIARLLSAAGGASIIGGQVTSDSAIELSLMDSPSMLYLWDEVGHIFSNIRSAANGGSPHLRTIVPTLMQLYSSSHKLYIGKQRAEGRSRRIDQPNVCVWGLTSPDVLYSSLSTAELRDGWLGRVLTFISQDRPRYNPKIRSTPPPNQLVKDVAAWLSFNPPALPGSSVGDIVSATTHAPVLFATDTGAMDVFESFRDEAYEAMMAADKSGDDCQYLWGKSLQNARRVALILAAGNYDPTRADATPIISRQLADIAVSIVRASVLTFAEAVRNNVADTESEAIKIRVLKVVQACGRDGISRFDFIRKTRFLRDRRSREDILLDLIDSGMVREDVRQTSKSGRPLTVYTANRNG